MSKSLCQALFFVVAVSLVSGQYLIETIYEDGECTNANGGVFVTSPLGGCNPYVGCIAMPYGLFKKELCAETYALETDKVRAIIYQNGATVCSGNFSGAIIVPLEVCTANPEYSVRVTGCNAQNSSLIWSTYKSVADCIANANPYDQVWESDVCIPGMGDDTKPICPVAAPVAPPMEAPVGVPVQAPMTAPMAAPVTAPVAAPKAATPVKKSDATLNAIFSVASIVVITLLV